jgi:hypothetical protein
MFLLLGCLAEFIFSWISRCWSILPHRILLFISNLISRIRERERPKKWIYVSCDTIYCRDIYISSHLNFWNLWRNGVRAFYSSPASSISILRSFKDFFPSLCSFRPNRAGCLKWRRFWLVFGSCLVRNSNGTSNAIVRHFVGGGLH